MSSMKTTQVATDFELSTPFERGNGNQTTTWTQCIAFYDHLALQFPSILRFEQMGISDTGTPIHGGIVSANGEFDRDNIKAAGRTIIFNNNGIHPGEPEGIDVCMALVRDFCTKPGQLAALGTAVFLFIPIYNVDGALNRQSTSRSNQVGPESFGFRGNGTNLDLNRDFIKCDSLAAQVFNQFFCKWDPDVMVDTHTSNGADYSYTMTLITTQADKLGGALGTFWRQQMAPAIYQAMTDRGWPTCPYVDLIGETPDDGIADFNDSPRYSTGYAALHHTIGMMPETHMLKPFADRYQATRALVEAVVEYCVAHGAEIQQLRIQAKAAAADACHTDSPAWPLQWQLDATQPATFRFKGYRAVEAPSVVGNYARLSYDRRQPWEKDIVHLKHYRPQTVAQVPAAYLINQSWRQVIARLRWNNITMHSVHTDQAVTARCYRFDDVQTRQGSYEGHIFHDTFQMSTSQEQLQTRPGDLLILLNQPNARYAIETLEPQAADSFFRWGFFDSVLERKEHFSDYVFEDTAAGLLATDVSLQFAFAHWKQLHPDQVSNQRDVLNFIFNASATCREPSWRRYPVFGLLAPGQLYDAP
jgi:hypothetical protein